MNHRSKPCIDMEPERIGAEQAGVIAGVHRNTIRRWALRGYLTVDRTEGGHRRYSESELRALLAEAVSRG